MRDLSLHLMDIIQNSISAEAAKVVVEISTNKNQDTLLIKVVDNGSGMDSELAASITDPFTTTRTTRKVGLGIPLLDACAMRAGGQLTVTSVKGQGTTLEASFGIRNIDRPPIGDIAETMVNVIMASPEIEFELALSNEKEQFDFNSFEVKTHLGSVPITEYSVLTWIREFIDEGMKSIFCGVLDEIVS